MTRNPFLSERHVVGVLDDAQIAAVIGAAGLGRCGGVRRIVDGYDNAVYRVRVRSGIVYVRTPLLPTATEAFQAEFEAMSLAARAVPVPEVLWLDPDGVPTDGRPVAVLAEAPGRRLDKDYRPIRALESLGANLAALHEVRLPGYWRPDNGRWVESPARMSELWVKDRYDDLAALADTEVGLSVTEVDRIAETLDEVPWAYGTEPAVLLHGDLGSGHVFVTGDQVSCLIDWGEWSGGTPISEFATLTRKWDAPALDAVRHGYGMDPGDEEFDHRVAVLSVAWLIGHLQHFWRAGDHDSVAGDLASLGDLVSR